VPQSSPIAERPPVALSIPAEPVGLREEVARDPARAEGWFADGERLVAFFWEAWGEELDPSGLTEAGLLEIVREYRRELWLWAMGERRWNQAAEGLAGRVRRRV
jgi:hypothetical protein